MFGLFKKKKEVTEEDIQKEIERLRKERQELIEKKQAETKPQEDIIIERFKNALKEADDELLDSLFQLASYNILMNGIKFLCRPELTFHDSNIITVAIKRMIDSYIDWKNTNDCILNKCLSRAIRQLKEERNNEKKDE